MSENTKIKKVTEADYNCPFCMSHLNVGSRIVISAKNSKGHRGLLFLSTNLGDYSLEKNANYDLNIGEEVEMFCSVCNKDLAYDYKDNKLACLIIVPWKGDEYEVIFSRIYGDERTYEVTGKEPIRYGEHALRYTDPEWFLNKKES